MFDPAANKWTDAAPLPQARDHAPTVVADGRIHVLGGRFDATADNTDVHSVYDPATNTWSSAPFLPEPRSGGSAVLYHDRILLMGGECDGGKPFAQNEAYDPKTMKWTALTAMPSGRHGFYAVSDGQAVYVAGRQSELRRRNVRDADGVHAPAALDELIESEYGDDPTRVKKEKTMRNRRDFVKALAAATAGGFVGQRGFAWAQGARGTEAARGLHRPQAHQGDRLARASQHR